MMGAGLAGYGLGGFGGVAARRPDQYLAPPRPGMLPAPQQLLRRLSVASFTAFGPSGDPTGKTDTANVNGALKAFQTVQLLGGQWFFSAGAPVGTGQALTGTLGTVIQPGTAWAPGQAMVQASGTDWQVWGLRFFGGSNTRSANPAADVLAVAAGSSRFLVGDLDVRFINGKILNCANVTAALHGALSAITGTNNATGFIVPAAASISAQVSFTAIDVQQFEVGDAFALTNVQDIQLDVINAAVQGASGGIPLHVAGGCSSVVVTNFDLGQFPNTGVNTPTQPTVLVESSGGLNPDGVYMVGGVAQRGLYGMRITGAGRHIIVNSVHLKLNQNSGFRDEGTSFGHLIESCILSANAQAGVLGTSDLEWTGGAAGMVTRNRFETTLGTGNGAVFSGGGTQVCDGNWFAGDLPATTNLATYMRANIGFNPVGPLTVGVPASGGSTAPRPFDCTVQLLAAAGGSVNVGVLVGAGQYSTFTVAAGGSLTFFVPASAAVQLTYGAGNAPTWSWGGN